MKNLLFNLVDGSENAEGTVLIDGMAPGKFVDMRGKRVEFKKEDLQTFVTNTLAALETTKDENGEIVGFPIDAIGHEHGEAAGWIKSVSLSENGEVIRFEVEWNDLGKKSIGQKILRYFSPQIDLQEKVIIGGSLTNYPATRTKKHEMLLKPVALSMSLFSLEGVSLDEQLQIIRDAFVSQFNSDPQGMWVNYPIEVFEGYLVCRHEDKAFKVGYVENEDGSISFEPMASWVEVKRTWIEASLEQFKRVLSGIFSGAGDNSTTEVDMEFDLEKATPEQKEVLLSQARASVIAEMQTNEPAELAELIKARTDEGVQAVLAVEKRKSHVAEFSARVVGGTPEAPVGLPVAKDALESLLLSLPEDKQAEVETLLGDIIDKGIVPFTELGHGKVAGGNRELPAEMKVHLQKWVDEGNKVEAWFTVNAAELGDMSEYNLAEFQEK